MGVSPMFFFFLVIPAKAGIQKKLKPRSLSVSYATSCKTNLQLDSRDCVFILVVFIVREIIMASKNFYSPLAWCLALICLVSPSWADEPLAITGLGKYSMPTGTPGGLSGITWAGGNSYYVVEDSGSRMYPLTVNLNVSGTVASTSLGSSVTLAGSEDIEGVAYDSSSSSLYVSGETDATIKQYNPAGGAAASTVTVPAVFTGYRTNYSLESLAMRSGNLEMWTANEEALANDGPLSSSTAGTVVRLQKFTRATVNDSFTAAGQWAYQTDPHTGTPAIGTPRSGVSDMCVLPNGKLLVLERELGGTGALPTFRNRIYEIDLDGATDTSAITALDGATYVLAAKTRLWEANFGITDNFEGMCLGPKLADDSYSMLLISDGDSPLAKSLYALKITGTVPEPTSLGILAMSLLAMLRRRAGR